MLNKFIGMGRLVKDPELKVTESGVNITRFTLAIDRRFQKQGEDRQADFLNVICFNKTAEFVSKWFAKGQMILVVGSVQTRSWEGQDGKKNYATEIIAEEVNFAGSKKDNSASPSNTSPVQDDFMPVEGDDSLPF